MIKVWARQIKVNKLKSVNINVFSISSIIIVLIWCAVDFSERFLFSSDSEMKASIAQDVIAYDVKTLSKHQMNSIKAGFDKFLSDEQKQQKETTNTLSEKEQRNQQGQLEIVYADNKTVELKGVVRDITGLKALVLVSDVKLNEQELKYVDNKHHILGYELTIISNTKVGLYRKFEQNEQQIELVMYKSS